MSSAAFAVTFFAWSRDNKWRWAYALIAVVFAYTTIVNMFERPDGLKIASFFIVSIVVASFVSRALRSTEVRIEKIELDEVAEEIISSLALEGDLRIVANRRETETFLSTDSKSTRSGSIITFPHRNRSCFSR
jgi:hypothetical protein